MFHGKGKRTWPDGDVYEGDFKDGLAWKRNMHICIN